MVSRDPTNAPKRRAGRYNAWQEEIDSGCRFFLGKPTLYTRKRGFYSNLASRGFKGRLAAGQKAGRSMPSTLLPFPSRQAAVINCPK